VSEEKREMESLESRERQMDFRNGFGKEKTSGMRRDMEGWRGSRFAVLVCS
jgi:hypothetical protein